MDMRGSGGPGRYVAEKKPSDERSEEALCPAVAWSCWDQRRSEGGLGRYLGDSDRLGIRGDQADIGEGSKTIMVGDRLYLWVL